MVVSDTENELQSVSGSHPMSELHPAVDGDLDNLPTVEPIEIAQDRQSKSQGEEADETAQETESQSLAEEQIEKQDGLQATIDETSEVAPGDPTRDDSTRRLVLEERHSLSIAETKKRRASVYSSERLFIPKELARSELQIRTRTSTRITQNRDYNLRMLRFPLGTDRVRYVAEQLRKDQSSSQNPTQEADEDTANKSEEMETTDSSEIKKEEAVDESNEQEVPLNMPDLEGSGAGAVKNPLTDDEEISIILFDLVKTEVEVSSETVDEMNQESLQGRRETVIKANSTLLPPFPYLRWHNTNQELVEAKIENSEEWSVKPEPEDLSMGCVIEEFSQVEWVDKLEIVDDSNYCAEGGATDELNQVDQQVEYAEQLPNTEEQLPEVVEETMMAPAALFYLEQKPDKVEQQHEEQQQQEQEEQQQPEPQLEMPPEQEMVHEAEPQPQPQVVPNTNNYPQFVPKPETVQPQVPQVPMAISFRPPEQSLESLHQRLLHHIILPPANNRTICQDANCAYNAMERVNPGLLAPGNQHLEAQPRPSSHHWTLPPIPRHQPLQPQLQQPQQQQPYLYQRECQHTSTQQQLQQQQQQQAKILFQKQKHEAELKELKDTIKQVRSRENEKMRRITLTHKNLVDEMIDCERQFAEQMRLHQVKMDKSKKQEEKLMAEKKQLERELKSYVKTLQQRIEERKRQHNEQELSWNWQLQQQQQSLQQQLQLQRQQLLVQQQQHQQHQKDQPLQQPNQYQQQQPEPPKQQQQPPRQHQTQQQQQQHHQLQQQQNPQQQQHHLFPFPFPRQVGMESQAMQFNNSAQNQQPPPFIFPMPFTPFAPPLPPAAAPQPPSQDSPLDLQKRLMQPPPPCCAASNQTLNEPSNSALRRIRQRRMTIDHRPPPSAPYTVTKRHSLTPPNSGAGDRLRYLISPPPLAPMQQQRSENVTNVMNNQVHNYLNKNMREKR